MDKQVVDYLKQTALDFFKSWPLIVKAKVSQEEGFLTISINTDKDDIFIQPDIDPLRAIQHLIRLMVRKKFPDQSIQLAVDIGDFRQRQKDAIERLAKEAIEKAIASDSSVDLLPMSSFERRLIHTQVTQDNRVTSESSGVGSRRHVVIKLN